MEILKVEHEQNLVRDTNSTAILNTNIEELHRHRVRRMQIQQKDDKILELSSRLANLEDIISKLTTKY